MKLDFSNMTIGSYQFNWARTLMVQPTGGADVSDCLKAAALIKDNDDESWTREWETLAEEAAQAGEQALQSGQRETARLAFLRASNYYRSAMFIIPFDNPHLFDCLTQSREIFHKAVGLFSPPIEAVEIPFDGARLPAYFISGGPGKRPTLLAINGGDSTNEELVHWFGFAAQSKGWNFLVFEGPGQWSALQLNPGLVLRADYEVPAKAVLDWLLQRDAVDVDKIGLIGLSLSAQLAARVAAFEKRIKACICFGGIVTDVNEAWVAVLPEAFRNAMPRVFDSLFASLEKNNPEARAFVNHFGWTFGVKKPHEVFDAWKTFSIKGLAPKIECPLLVLTGEGEYEQTDDRMTLSVLKFLKELTCPVTIHEFRYTDGWAASHCSVGDERPANAIIFDWLDRTLLKGETPKEAAPISWDLLRKYHHTSEIDNTLKDLRVTVV